jgi:hypothetical protein
LRQNDTPSLGRRSGPLDAVAHAQITSEILDVGWVSCRHPVRVIAPGESLNPRDDESPARTPGCLRTDLEEGIRMSTIADGLRTIDDLDV